MKEVLLTEKEMVFYVLLYFPGFNFYRFHHICYFCVKLPTDLLFAIMFGWGFHLMRSLLLYIHALYVNCDIILCYNYNLLSLSLVSFTWLVSRSSVLKLFPTFQPTYVTTSQLQQIWKFTCVTTKRCIKNKVFH